MQPYYGYGAPVPQPTPVQPGSQRPQWWIAAVVAVGFGVVEAPFTLLSLVFPPLLTTAGLLLLAAIATTCFITGRRAPNADAVGLGFVVALLLNVAVYLTIGVYSFYGYLTGAGS